MIIVYSVHNISGGSRSSSKGGRFIYFIFRVARCPVFSRTVRYFAPLSSIRMIVIPDNASVNSSIFCQCPVFLREQPAWQPYSHFKLQLPATLTNHRLKVASRKQPLGLYSELQPQVSHCLMV